MSGQNLFVADLSRVVRYGHRADQFYRILGISILLIVMMVLFVLVFNFVYTGWERFGWDFITSYPSSRPGRAGILPAWVGTALLMIFTAILAVPIGVATGVYLEEYAPNNRLTRLIEVNISNLAGVPSIIYGIFALGLFVRGLELGETILVAGLTLALLILPIIIVSTREAIRSIPLLMREAAVGLGADKWQSVRSFILPAAKPGIITGAIIGLSRAIGEAAPILTVGAVIYIRFLPPPPVSDTFPFINFEWIQSSFSAMPILMFDWTGRPQSGFHVNAAAIGAILLLMTLAMNGIAIYIRYHIRKAMK